MSTATKRPMLELGELLSQARTARGVSFEEAERDTRISRRYLEALEREDFSAFPAPFYARAFLRTYAQYVGLDANQVLNILPQNRLEPELTPLPEVERPTTPAFTVNLVVTAVVILFLIGAALLVWAWGSGGEERALPGAPVAVDGGTAGEAIANGEGSPGAIEAQQEMAPPPAAVGQPVAPVEPGVVPDFRDALLEDSLAALQQLGMDYVVIEVDNPDVAPGLVFDQNPAPGTNFKDGEPITLVVSRVQ